MSLTLAQTSNVLCRPCFISRKRLEFRGIASLNTSYSEFSKFLPPDLQYQELIPVPNANKGLGTFRTMAGRSHDSDVFVFNSTFMDSRLIIYDLVKKRYSTPSRSHPSSVSGK